MPNYSPKCIIDEGNCASPVLNQFWGTNKDGTIGWQEGLGAGGMFDNKQEIITLTATDITNKYVTLENTPIFAEAVDLCIYGGSMRLYGEDFVVFPSGSDILLSWDTTYVTSPSLENNLIVGDKLIITYIYTTTSVASGIKIEQIELTTALLTARRVELQQFPLTFSAVEMQIISGLKQLYGVDYTVYEEGDDHIFLEWSVELNNKLEVGEFLHIFYVF